MFTARAINKDGHRFVQAQPLLVLIVMYGIEDFLTSRVLIKDDDTKDSEMDIVDMRLKIFVQRSSRHFLRRLETTLYHERMFEDREAVPHLSIPFADTLHKT